MMSGFHSITFSGLMLGYAWEISCATLTPPARTIRSSRNEVPPAVIKGWSAYLHEDLGALPPEAWRRSVP